MKKKIKTRYWFFMAFVMLFLSGCGQKQPAEQHKEIKAETQQLPQISTPDDPEEPAKSISLGVQFYQEEKLQLAGEESQNGYRVYLCRENGDKELFMENVDYRFLQSYTWWLDKENRCFLLSGREIIRPDREKELRWNSDDGILFKSQSDENESLQNLCQLSDGRIIGLSLEGLNQKLWELHPDSGRRDIIQTIPITTISLAHLVAADGNELLLLSDTGIWHVNPDNGKTTCRISFEGTSFTLKEDEYGIRTKKDFKVQKDGKTELLWSDGIIETLSLESIQEDREFLTLRCALPSSWLKEQIAEFNRENEEYYIVIEEFEDSYDLSPFLEQTDLTLGTGKGADLICSDAVNDAYSLINKGVFADLSPFMESSDIREEDYFPAAFSGWKDGGRIYGVNYIAEVQNVWANRDIIGAAPLSGAEDLADRLLAYEGDAVFMKNYSAVNILRYFLQNSENLCGMVDMENGTCDFGGELFVKLLKAAEKYGDNQENPTPVTVMGTFQYLNFYCFMDDRILEDLGRVRAGYLFEDGVHAELRSNILAINAQSPRKDGAWEFIRFMLGDEVQSRLSVSQEEDLSSTFLPINRKVFNLLCEEHSETYNNGTDSLVMDNSKNIINVRTGLTQERKQELAAVLESAGTAPLQVKPLMRVVLDEAKNYFSGDKSIEEIRIQIENRVQLYLNERE